MAVFQEASIPKFCTPSFVYPILATCRTHRKLIDFTILCDSSNHEAFPYFISKMAHLFSSFLGPDIVLSALCSNTYNIYMFLPQHKGLCFTTIQNKWQLTLCIFSVLQSRLVTTVFELSYLKRCRNSFFPLAPISSFTSFIFVSFHCATLWIRSWQWYIFVW